MKVQSDDESLDTVKIDLDISKERADWLFHEAGELVGEDEEQIKIERYEHLMSDKIHIIIQEVLNENNIVFKLQVKELMEMMGLREQNTIVMSADPVQSQ